MPIARIATAAGTNFEMRDPSSAPPLRFFSLNQLISDPSVSVSSAAASEAAKPNMVLGGNETAWVRGGSDTARSSALKLLCSAPIIAPHIPQKRCGVE